MSRWTALQNALAVNVPSCAGDDRFTADDGEHDADLRTICAGCPVREQCAEFARTGSRNGVWGFYGGIVRRSNPQVRTRR